MSNSELLNLGVVVILALAWISWGVWNINDKLKEIISKRDVLAVWTSVGVL